MNAVEGGRSPAGVSWPLAVFLLVAGYALAAGLLVQFVFAPSVGAPGTPAGLIPGLDTVSFHRFAVDVAAKMAKEGLSGWEWNPGWSANQPASLMALAYHWFGIHPAVLLPFNALVHGLGATILFLLFRQLGFGSRASFAAILPFAFFPSTLTWVAQFHKDGIYALGFFLLLSGAVRLVGPGIPGTSGGAVAFSLKADAARAIPCILLGGWIAATIRPYGVTLFLVAGLLAALVVTAAGWVREEGRGNWRMDLLRLALLGAGLAALLPAAGSAGGRLESEPPSQPGMTAARTDAVFTPGVDDTPPPSPWNAAAWLPAPIDRAFLRLAHNRNIFLWMFPDSGSLVDADKTFQNSADVVVYLPRALQVGLFAPFPSQWFGEAASPTGGIQRKVAAVETLFVYLCIAAAIAGLVGAASRRRWFAVLACVLMILPLVYAIPAVGSLYRLRFAPFAVLIGLGLAFAVGWWHRRNSRTAAGRKGG